MGDVDSMVDTQSLGDSQFVTDTHSQGDLSDEDELRSTSAAVGPGPSIYRQPSPVLIPDRQTQTPRSTVTTACQPPRTKRRKVDSMSTFETSFLEIAKAQASRLDKQTEKEEEKHPMDAYFESCALRAKRLTQAKQGWLQMQISTLMYIAETNENMPQYAPMMGQTFATPYSQRTDSYYPAPATSTIEGYVNIPTCSIGGSSQNQPQTGLDILSAATVTLH